MARDVPEWIGKTSDSPIPPRVKLRIWERENGKCYLSGLKINALKDKFEYEHIVPLCLGGENRESNIALALKQEHKKKTSEDMKKKAKVSRLRKKEIGIKKKTSFPTNRNGKYKKKMNGEVVER